ncbi:hypothetical protein ACHAW6_014062 [Cyclotella cf. meneghiniana]
MADTAAFFAKKKKGKKFKAFNANKIDVASVIPTTHVDAPEVTETALGELNIGDDQWADSSTSWGGANAPTSNTGAGSKVAELLDMQALKSEEDVAERLRIEETKAQLARAKEGMAKEAERLEKEKREKEEKAAARKMGLGVSMGEGLGGKWMPSHLRAGGSSTLGPASMDGAKQPNVADEELFPDLAAADKILAEKERQEKLEQERILKGQLSTQGGIRAPSGWGSRVGSLSMGAGGSTGQRQPLNLAPKSTAGAEEVLPQRKPLNLAPPSIKSEDVPSVENAASPPVPAESPETKTEEKMAEESDVKTESVAPPATVEEQKTESSAPKKDIVLKKKKKKDLSSFKASST